ncbi:MAG: SpoIIE family protein phosphatase, partial [Oscillospiraceae bacterium]|nr:SpoIIE family protein phosphatase [Oscillospiraceae bacterium]
ISDFVERASAGLTGVEELSIDGTEYYVSGAPLSAVGWTVVSVLDKSVTKAPEKAMLAEYENITDRSTSTFMDKLSSLTRQTALMMIIALAVCYVISLTMANRIVKPVNSMSKKVMEIAGTSEPFEMSEMYRTSDEIQVLAESFEEMTHKNMEYIRQITDITREKERLGTELELARKIQADMLPSIFPAFPDMSDEFDVYATMTPAKEVGGDFYDFFLIDEDHLAIVMADVSGKGVPAALFMMMSKILINNYAMMGSSPTRVLEQANDTICQNNDEEMFVTVWFGIYEIHTGKVIAANAGHEYPVLRSADGRFEVMKDKHGFVVGGMEGVRYKEYEFTVEKGGALFLYTDGVAEAVNENDEMFGLDRMIDTLNSDEKGDPVSLLGSMHRSLDSFVGGADQFDDITMLALVHK